MEGLLVQVLTVTNLINSEPLENQAAAGFDAYRFPTWSIALGWFIFVVCILPMPLCYILTYVQGYRKLAAARMVSQTSVRRSRICTRGELFQRNSGFNHGNAVTDGSTAIPVYLEAFKLNNSPGELWGPKRRADQVGRYAHLRVEKSAVSDAYVSRPPSAPSRASRRKSANSGVDNPTFDSRVGSPYGGDNNDASF